MGQCVVDLQSLVLNQPQDIVLTLHDAGNVEVKTFARNINELCSEDSECCYPRRLCQ